MKQGSVKTRNNLQNSQRSSIFIGFLFIITALTAIGVIAQNPRMWTFLKTSASKLPSSLSATPKATATTTPKSALQPVGAKPAGFTTYKAANNSFALYISTSWTGTASEISWNHTLINGATFTSNGASLPTAQIYILPQILTAAQIQSVVATLAGTQGYATYSASAPAPIVIAGKNWTAVSISASFQGSSITAQIAFRQQNNKTAVFFEAALPIQFSGYTSEDFTPMAASLAF